MQKYVLISLLEPVGAGASFSASDWPLHVTLASNFVIDWDNTGLYGKLAALLAKRSPVVAQAGEDEYFGPSGQIQVTLLSMSPELRSLHDDITRLLKSVGAVFDEPQYLEGGYRAHATVQPHARLRKGDRVIINELTIVDMFWHGDIHRRKLLGSIKLSGR